jgi:hypothetical protein
LGVKQEFEFNEWYEKDQKKIREKFGEENYQRLEKVSLAKVLSEFFEFYSVYVQQGLEEGQEIFSIDISSSKNKAAKKTTDVFPVEDPFDPSSRPAARPFNLVDKRIVKKFFWEAYQLITGKEEGDWEKNIETLFFSEGR